MSKWKIVPLDLPHLPPKEIGSRLRAQLNYFMSVEGEPGVPALSEGEFWFDPSSVAQWLDDGVIYLVSPLDTANKTEVEISEEQEEFLNWLKSTGVRHVRVVG